MPSIFQELRELLGVEGWRNLNPVFKAHEARKAKDQHAAVKPPEDPQTGGRAVEEDEEEEEEE